MLQVLYVLQLHQDCEAGTAHVSSVSEFLLTQPVLSFALLDAGRRRLVKAQEYDAEHAWSCTTGMNTCCLYWVYAPGCIARTLWLRKVLLHFQKFCGDVGCLKIVKFCCDLEQIYIAWYLRGILSFILRYTSPLIKFDISEQRNCPSNCQ